MLKEKLPVLSGKVGALPESTPVEVLNDRPAGGVAGEMAYVYGAVPPLAVNV